MPPISDITEVAQKVYPLRVEVHWIGNRRLELEVCHIPIAHLYFNIENGRYADRMIRLKHENPGVEIDPKEENWKFEIEKMLAGEHKDTSRDRVAFDKLIGDIKDRTQLRPGVSTIDGGVIDGNRRLAALRRLNAANRERFRTFDGVILPTDTTTEDRWRIEAGLQLGVNERWDYSPINELLKIRAGVRMYEDMIQKGSIKKDASPIQLVTKAIYGKTEAQVKEMVGRLDLIDEYLRFIKKPGAYDEIGALSVSERFLEASRIVQAAENNNHGPSFLVKLKSVLFYEIGANQMDNRDLRKIYHALGGDPRKRGPKPKLKNPDALKEFLDEFPEPKIIQGALATDPEPLLAAKKPLAPHRSATPSSTSGPKPPLDKARLGAATERFVRTMEASTKSKGPRKIAAGASAEISALRSRLEDKSLRKSLTVEDRASIMEAIESMQRMLVDCSANLKRA